MFVLVGCHHVTKRCRFAVALHGNQSTLCLFGRTLLVLRFECRMQAGGNNVESRQFDLSFLSYLFQLPTGSIKVFLKA